MAKCPDNGLIQRLLFLSCLANSNDPNKLANCPNNNSSLWGGLGFGGNYISIREIPHTQLCAYVCTHICAAANAKTLINNCQFLLSGHAQWGKVCKFLLV